MSGGNVKKPRIGLVIGDPAGIGPELSAKLIASGAIDSSTLAVFGSRDVLFGAAVTSGLDLNQRHYQDKTASDVKSGQFILVDQPDRAVPLGVASPASGAYVLDGLRHAADAVRRGEVDGILYAPLNKQAMVLAGHKALDELHYFRDLLGVEGFCCELNNQGPLWTVRVTSHMPLGEVARNITPDNIRNAVQLGVEAVRRAGVAAPKVMVAGLNPHMGEGGTMGREEIDVILPTVAQLQGEGIDILGVFPADTVIPRALKEGVDLVVTMYHDQGQIALKALGFDRTVTMLGGLPVPFATPSQGSAYDIAGKNLADPSGLIAAFGLLQTIAGKALAERAGS